MRTIIRFVPLVFALSFSCLFAQTTTNAKTTSTAKVNKSSELQSSSPMEVKKAEPNNSPNIISDVQQSTVVIIIDDPSLINNSNSEQNNSQPNTHLIKRIKVSKSDLEFEPEEKRAYILSHPEIYEVE